MPVAGLAGFPMRCLRLGHFPLPMQAFIAPLRPLSLPPTPLLLTIRRPNHTGRGKDPYARSLFRQEPSRSRTPAKPVLAVTITPAALPLKRFVANNAA